MYIAIAGIKRSGSTWQANAVRLYCERQGLKVWMGEDKLGLEKEGYDVTISKLHPYEPIVAERADFVFTSYRSPRGIIESWKRFKGENLNWGTLDAWLWWLMKWQEKTSYCMPYSMLTQEAGKVVALREIDNVLANPISEMLDEDTPMISLKELRKAVDAVKPPTDKDYDPETCLFKNHITQPLEKD